MHCAIGGETGQAKNANERRKIKGGEGGRVKGEGGRVVVSRAYVLKVYLKNKIKKKKINKGRGREGHTKGYTPNKNTLSKTPSLPPL